MALCLAGAACGSDGGRRGPEAPSTPTSTPMPEPAPLPCSDLVGRWREVEPIDGTNIDDPEDGKVRAISPGTWLYIDLDRKRLTIVSATERAESSIFVERAPAGSCLLHVRDSLGRPLDVEAALITERLLRLHNIAEPRSPSTLYERR
jgi:hypothetical protein